MASGNFLKHNQCSKNSFKLDHKSVFFNVSKPDFHFAQITVASKPTDCLCLCIAQKELQHEERLGMTYRLTWEHRGVLLEFFGQISARDSLQATIEYESDIRFDDLLYVIVDYSQIEGCNAIPADIEDIWVADVGAKLSNAKIKKAIVTTTSEVIAMANRYKSDGDYAFPTTIFATLPDARAWLNSG